MSVDVQPRSDNSLATTLQGVVEDIQTLILQQLAMVRAEVRSDWQNTKAAVWPMLLGGGLALIGLMLFCFTAVFLLHYLTAPAGADPAALPLWACFAIVGGAFALIGGGAIWAGIRKFQSFNPLPDESTRALAENLQWLTKEK